MAEDNSSIECAICLQPMLYPVKLPCSHNFCFLCIKGLRDPSSIKRCAMCRTQFSLEQIEQTLELGKEYFTKKIKWLYEARTGNSWWAFDERTSVEIEEAFNASKDQISINIAGFTYIIDFKSMHQFRYDNRQRIRKIKRQEDDELCESYKIKGIAGLRVAKDNNNEETQDISDDLSQKLDESLKIRGEEEI